MATLVTLAVAYYDDYFTELWATDSTLLGAARMVNKFNDGNFGSKLTIKGAAHIDDFNMHTSVIVEELRAANIHLSLNDFIYEE